MDRLLSALPKRLHNQVMGHYHRTEPEDLSPDKVQSPDCRRSLAHVQDLINFLDDKSKINPQAQKKLRHDISEYKRLALLIHSIDNSLSENRLSLSRVKNSQTKQKILSSNYAYKKTLDSIDVVIKRLPARYHKAFQSTETNFELLTKGVIPEQLLKYLDRDNSPDDLTNKLNELQSALAEADETNIGLCCLSAFPYIDHFTDPQTGALKTFTAQDGKHFGKWCALFDQTFERYGQTHGNRMPAIFLHSLKRVLNVFDKSRFEFSNLNTLLKLLQSLGKPHFQQYHPHLTGILISIFSCQLKNLNAIIKDKAGRHMPFKLELGYKSKLIDAINKLLPDWQSLNNDEYLQLLSNIPVKNDDSYWFDLIYTLSHHASNNSHQLSSDHWQETLLTVLESHDPDARQILTAMCHQEPSAALKVATNNHRLLWLQAFLYNQAGDHQHAYQAISAAEERCNELGCTPEPRLQLEIVRIKLDSLKAMSTSDELQPDDLRLIIKQLDKLTGVQEGCTTFNHSALVQLTPWTNQEITQVELLKSEALALKKASGRTSPPQVSLPQENDEPPVQEVPQPVAPVFSLPSQSPEAICQKMLRHLQPKQHQKQVEVMTSDDTFLVMASNGKPLSVADAMKKDNWNRKVFQLLEEIKEHRSDGDFIRELEVYHDILTSKTDKQKLGVHRLMLELSWTLMRHVDRAMGEKKLTTEKAATLLDYAWQFMLLSIQRAMGMSSSLPEQVSDKQLVTTVTEWLQALEDVKVKDEMEFFMRCALGSTAGHINGFRAELFPDKRAHLDERAAHFFNAKHALQPGYVRPENNKDHRSVCMYQPQVKRWSR